MRVDDGAADRQPHAQTAGLRGEEGAEQPVDGVPVDPDARVLHGHQNLIAAVRPRANHQLRRPVPDGRHRLDTIHHEVDEHLLELDSITEDGGQRRRQVHPQRHPMAEHRGARTSGTTSQMTWLTSSRALCGSVFEASWRMRWITSAARWPSCTMAASASRTTSRSGRAAANQLRDALASATMAASGWLISWRRDSSVRLPSGMSVTVTSTRLNRAGRGGNVTVTSAVSLSPFRVNPFEVGPLTDRSVEDFVGPGSILRMNALAKCLV